jgi:hypothetical protein
VRSRNRDIVVSTALPTYEWSHLLLVAHVGTRRISLRIRHSRYFRRRKNNSGALGSESRTARHCHGLGPLWHRRRALLGGWPADRFGRKATLLWIGILYFVGAVGSGVAPNVTIFIIARVIGGLGIGISTVVAPMYISEIAPPKHRGRACRHVPVQYCFWHPDRLRIERAVGGHRRECLALDAGRGGVSVVALCDILLWPSPKVHAGC